MNIFTMAITLFFVMDSLGNIPIFLSLLSDVSAKKRTWIILRECIFAFLILLLFMFFGDDILFGLGITQHALSIAGGIILFLIALKMIFPPPEELNREKITEPFIVPLAIPLVAGPSAIATVMLFTSEAQNDNWGIFIALVLSSVASTIVLLSASILRRILGQKGLIAIERLMGMILTTIAVQMFLNGIKNYFQ